MNDSTVTVDEQEPDFDESLDAFISSLTAVDNAYDRILMAIGFKAGWDAAHGV